MGNIISLVVIAILLGGGTFLLYKKRASEKKHTWLQDDDSFDKLVSTVLKDCTEITKIDRGLVYRDLEYESSRRNKERIAIALKQCVYGEENARAVVISTMREIISRYLTDLEKCNSVIDLSNLRETLTPEEKFEILIYELKIKHDKNVLVYLNKKYNLTEDRKVDSGYIRKEIDIDFINHIFNEQMPYNELDYEQALDVIAIFVYQRSKGFGKVDTLRTLNIDGLELGTSGSIRYKMLNTKPNYVIERSCWIQLEARWIHLSFINFESVDEIRRLILNMSNVEGSEALTVKKPLKVVDSYNGDRITCIREGAGATNGIFIRSFSAGIVSVQQWLNRPEAKNWEIVDRLLYFLAQCDENTAFTGQQNTGKTTLMKGFVGYYKYVNIRVLEMSFELNLNELYPERNVFCTKPTPWVSATDIQTQLKKTDGFVSLVGEIASDDVATNAIQFGQVGSSSTIFSHHGIDYKGLIDGLTGSLLATGVYSDEGAAQSVVLDVVKHNIHLDFYGKLRVVDYVEEIVKGERIIPYQNIEKSGDIVEAIDQSTALNREYYQRSTDRINYTSRKIITFDKLDGTYKPNQWYTPERFEAMLKKMPEHLLPEFLDFYEENWGKRLRKRGA